MKIKKIDSLNLIPFIDIMLVLLVIVLTTTTFISKDAINIDIPKIDNPQNNTLINKEEIIISINKDGNIFLNNEKISKEELSMKISQLDKDSNIVINGDKNSNFNDFVNIMNVLEKLGFDNLFILVNDK